MRSGTGCRFFLLPMMLLVSSALPAAAVETLLTYDSPRATAVTIVGTFNGWNENANPLVRDSQGLWSITLDLEPGVYDYKYVVDGSQQVTDPRMPLSTGKNSFLTVAAVIDTDLARFKFASPESDTVFLVGDFNYWSETATPMKWMGNNRWSAALPLATGVYRYQFKIRGEVKRSPHSDDVWERASEKYGSYVRQHVVLSSETTVSYHFRLTAPSANRVRVVGDFTGGPGKYLRDDDGDGTWEVELPVEPRIHEYYFIVDKVEWIPDPESDDYGGGYSLLIADTRVQTNRPILDDPVRRQRLSPATRYAHLSKRAYAYTVLGRYEEARATARDAFTWAMQLDSPSVGMALWRIAHAEFELGNDSEAFRLLELSRKIFPEANIPLIDEIYIKAATIGDKSVSGFAPLLFGEYLSQLNKILRQGRDYWRDQTFTVRDVRLPRFMLEQWVGHMIGEDSRVWSELKRESRLAEGSDFFVWPFTVNLYTGMLARDLGDTVQAAIHFDSALLLNPDHLFARYYRDHLVPPIRATSSRELPGFYFLGVHQQGRRWDHLGQNEAVIEALREKIEQSGVMRWVDADDLRQFAIEKGIPFSRAVGSEKFFQEYSVARNVPLMGELLIRHEGNAINCELSLGKVEDLKISDITASLNHARAESVTFRMQGAHRLEDMAERVRDELVAHIDVAAKVVMVGEREVRLSIGAENGIAEGRVFLVSRKSRIFVNAESGETIVVPGKSARLKITDLQARVSMAEIIEISPQFSVETGMSAVLDRSSIREAEASALESERGRLRLRDKRFSPIFPVARLHYADHGIGEIKIRNTGDRTLMNVRVTFEVPGLMDLPVEVCSEERLREGAYLSGEVNPVFTEKLLEQTTATAKQGVLKMSWEYEGRPREEQIYVPLKVMGRNAMIWRDKMMVGAFVNPRDPAIVDFRSSIFSQASTDYPFLDRSLASAIVLFDSLKNIKYQSDPNAPYVGTDTQVWSEDYIQFPTETLRRSTGDCDDMAVLYATLLEAVGIPVRFVLVPGHIFVHFKTGVSAAEWEKLGLPERTVIRNDGAVWLPVETTMYGYGFMAAVEKGAEESRGTIEDVVNVHEAWTHYDPVSIAGAAPVPEIVLAWNGYREEIAAIRKNQDMLLDQKYLVADPNDSLARKAQGFYLWQAGRYEAAEAAWKDIGAIAGNDGEVKLLMGLMAMRRGSRDEAEGMLRMAGSLLPKSDPRSSFNLAVLWVSQDRIADARRAFAHAVSIDPALAAHESALFGAGAGSRGADEPIVNKMLLTLPAADTTPDRDRVFEEKAASR